MKKLIWLACLPMVLWISGCDFEERIPAEMSSVNQARPLGKEKTLDAHVRFDIGSLEVTGSKTPNVYSMDLEYDKSSYQPDVSYETAGDEGRLTFRLEITHKLGIRTQRQSNRLRLNFNDSIPLKLSVNTGVGDARLSLTGMKVERLDLEAGVGGSKISVYEPNPVTCEFIRIKNGVGSMDAVGLGNLNFRELEFEGGVGGANLDFTGSWKQDADVRIQVGVGGVSARMPREVGVRVEAEKHFLSGLHLDGFNKRDSYYYSDNYDKAKTRITLRVATGVGGFKISWL
ncbi:MAG TPA: toast rack family protein [Acidobacteriota bacterium]|nr:toast rack family protein [Acidobacteriota bacterium]